QSKRRQRLSLPDHNPERRGARRRRSPARQGAAFMTIRQHRSASVNSLLTGGAGALDPADPYFEDVAPDPWGLSDVEVVAPEDLSFDDGGPDPWDPLADVEALGPADFNDYGEPRWASAPNKRRKRGRKRGAGGGEVMTVATDSEWYKVNGKP